MKRHPNNRALRLGIHAKVIRNDGTVHSTTMWVKERLVDWVQEQRNIKSIYLKVTYKPGLWNDCTVTTIEKFRYFLSSFTEKPLIDYVERTK